MKKLLITTAAILALGAAPANAAYCGSNEYFSLHTGDANTSCGLAINTTNHAVSYYNRHGYWPYKVSGYSPVRHRWYQFKLATYLRDYIKYRGRAGDAVLTFSLSGKNIVG